jgi:hypothetical protein
MNREGCARFGIMMGKMGIESVGGDDDKTIGHSREGKCGQKMMKE